MLTFHSYRLLLLLLFCAFFCSAGADTIDNYQVYFQNKIAYRESDRLIDSGLTQKMIRLKAGHEADTITVFYNYCSPGTTFRKIRLYSGAQSIIYEQEFGGSESEHAMRIPVKALFQSTGMQTGIPLSLYYSDNRTNGKGELLGFIRIYSRPDYEQTTSSFPKNALILFLGVGILLTLYVRNRTKRTTFRE